MADSEEFLRDSEEQAAEEGFYYSGSARELEYNQINSRVTTKIKDLTSRMEQGN